MTVPVDVHVDSSASSETEGEGNKEPGDTKHEDTAGDKGGGDSGVVGGGSDEQ